MDVHEENKWLWEIFTRAKKVLLDVNCVLDSHDSEQRAVQTEVTNLLFDMTRDR